MQHLGHIYRGLTTIATFLSDNTDYQISCSAKDMANLVYGPDPATWPFFALPPPVPPTPPDFHLCHPFYGTNMVKSQCTQAAGRLPPGTQPASYGESIFHPHARPYILPETFTFGDCHIIIEAADDSLANYYPSVMATPDKFRELASWLITGCVELSGLGGFGTISLQNMINWVANETTSNGEIVHDVWPANSVYFTVTVTKLPQLGDFTSAWDDPTVAEALADGVAARGNSERGRSLSAVAGHMSRTTTRNGQTPWWGYLDPGNSPSPGEDDSEMVYTCDAKLGAPSAADCSQLAYSGLGPVGDTIIIGPGSSRNINFKSCNVAISALKTIVLTWAQISAGLSSLVDNCVEHPLRASRGGIAYPTNPTSMIAGHHGKRRNKGDPRATGLKALPPGVILTLFAGNSQFDAANPGKGLKSCKAAGNNRECFKTST